MTERLKSVLTKIQEVWTMLQDLASVQGGLFVDLFAIAMVVRLIGPLFGRPPLSAAEAGLWAATIGAFAYSNRPPNGQA